MDFSTFEATTSPEGCDMAMKMWKQRALGALYSSVARRFEAGKWLQKAAGSAGGADAGGRACVQVGSNGI